MYRIDVPTAAATPVAPAALGTEGHWTKGIPGVTAATVLDQDWFEALQENIIAVVDAGGVAHSKSDYTVLRRAIQALVRASGWVAKGNTGASLALDFSTGSNFTAMANANFTLANPTNVTPGQEFFIKITQDGTGGRTITYGANFIAPGGVRPAISTAIGAVDIISGVVDDNGKCVFALNRGIA